MTPPYLATNYYLARLGDGHREKPDAAMSYMHGGSGCRFIEASE
jgi:hypothetical protein